MDLSECLKKGLIKRTSVNTGLIASLIEMSDIKEETVKKAKRDEKNISVYVSVAYDSLREILEAICIGKEYKVLSHLCLGELMKTLVNDFEFNEFDRMRYIRNGINYYGTKVEFEQGEEIINKIFAMKNKLKESHLKK